MAYHYKALPYFSISPGARINRHTQEGRTDVDFEDPAALVMTDFTDVTPVSIEATASIDAANSKMIACSVRLLFVTDNEDTLLGLITATDILGERPLQYLKEHGGKRDEIMVRDIMTVHENLLTLHMSDVQSACVGDIVETMKEFGRQHILVSETGESEEGESIRGIFSTTQISRQVGLAIDLVERATSFAEVKKALAEEAMV